MARIHVTTDDGTIVASWTDRDPENGDDAIGEWSSRANRDRLIGEIEHAVRRARTADRRQPTTGDLTPLRAVTGS